MNDPVQEIEKNAEKVLKAAEPSFALIRNNGQ